jgi:DNA-binding YbaB/EbfC family protein
MKEELKRVKIISESGGGMVRVEGNGFGDITNLDIEEELYKGEDKKLMEDLIISAINKNKEKTKEIFQQKLQETIGFLPLDTIKDLMP